MTMEIKLELDCLGSEIARRRQFIEDQQNLIQVLEHDGHDVLEQEVALGRERSLLAVQIARQFELRHPNDVGRQGSLVEASKDVPLEYPRLSLWLMFCAWRGMSI